MFNSSTAAHCSGMTAARLFNGSTAAHFVSTAAQFLMMASLQHDVTAAHCFMTAARQHLDIVLNAMRN